jgi:hypothetical protein
MVKNEPGRRRVAQGFQTSPFFPESGPLLSDMMVRHLFHEKRHLVSHTLQRIVVLIQVLELQVSLSAEQA